MAPPLPKGATPIGGGFTPIQLPLTPQQRVEEARKVRDQQIQEQNAALAAASAARDAARFNMDVSNKPTQIAGDIRKEFRGIPVVKAYENVLPTYISAIRGKPSRADDIALIYAAAKVWDPDSVVREAEVGMARNTDTYLNSIANEFGFQLGEKGKGVLSEDARNGLKLALANRMGVLNAQYSDVRNQYIGIADEAGIKWQNVVGATHPGSKFSLYEREFLKDKDTSNLGAFAGTYNLPLQIQAEPGSIATGGETGARNEWNTKYGPELVALFKRGASDQDIREYLKANNLQTNVEEILAARAAEPLWSPGMAYTTTFSGSDTRPTTPEEAAAGSRVTSYPGALLANYANIAGAGIPQALVGNEPFQAIQQAQPEASTIGQILGGVTGGLGAARLGARLLPRLGGAAPVVGEAIYGGATGAATAPEDERLSGGLLGAGLTVGGYGLGRGLGYGVGRGRELLSTGPSYTAGERAIAENIGDLGQAGEMLRQGQQFGIPVTAADLSAGTQQLGGSVVRRSPTWLERAQQLYGGRNLGQINRLEEAVTRELGPTVNVPMQSERLVQEARLRAGPLYEEAFQQPGAGAIYESIQPIINTPMGQRALRQAVERVRNRPGADVASLGFDFNEAGDVVLREVPSWRTLNEVKRGFDRVIKSATDPVEKADALNLKRMFTRITDQANPKYAEARRVYSGPRQGEEALEFGRKAVTSPTPEVEAIVSKWSGMPERMKQAQLGYRSGLLEQAEKSRLTANPWEAILGSPGQQGKLGIVYPNQPGPANLVAQQQLEQRLATAPGQIYGGSTTQLRQRADEAFDLSPAADIAMSAATRQPILPKVFNYLGDTARVGVGKARAEQIGPELFDPSISQTTESIEDFLARQQALKDYFDSLNRARGNVSSGGGYLGVGLTSPIFGGNNQ